MKNKDFELGSGNVFADLGFPNPEEELTKAKLVSQINNLIKEKGLTQAVAAKILGTEQSKISNLKRGNWEGFSIERLFRFLNSLGQDIDIEISPSAPEKAGEVNVKLVKYQPTNKKEIEKRPALMAKKSN